MCNSCEDKKRSIGIPESEWTKGQRADGWTLTGKGRELRTQINPRQIFWVPEIRNELPDIMELLEFAERLGLKDMKSIH